MSAKMLDRGCRWEDEAEKALQPVEVIFYSGESDYQGNANAMVRRADGSIAHLGWGWGSCTGCDPYEGDGDDGGYSAALEDFSKSIQVMTPTQAIAFVKALPVVEHSYDTDKLRPADKASVLARLAEIEGGS